MEMDASGTNTERPTPGATYLSSPNWLVRTVRGLIPPGPGSRWKLKDADVLMAIDDSKAFGEGGARERSENEGELIVCGGRHDRQRSIRCQLPSPPDG